MAAGPHASDPSGIRFWNVAVIVVSAVSVKVQGPGPVHPPPLQPAKTEPAAGVADNVITVSMS